MAGGIGLSKVQVAGKGVESSAETVNLSIKGRLDPNLLDPADAPLSITLGEFTQEVDAGDVVDKGKKLLFRGAKGEAGIRKFSVSTRSGKFSLKARAVSAGEIDDRLVMTLAVGDCRTSVSLPVEPSRKRAKWRDRDPVEVIVKGRVFRVSADDDVGIVLPGGGMTFVRDDTEEATRIKSGDPETDLDGRFEVVIEVDDQSQLDDLDLGLVLGSSDGDTPLQCVTVTPGTGGEVHVVGFVQEESGAGSTIAAGQETVIETTRDDALRGGSLTFPSGAVMVESPRVKFTPLVLPIGLPAPLPEGYVPVAGAHIASEEPVILMEAMGGMLDLERPEWTAPEDLEGATLVLLQFEGGQWTERPGTVMYDEESDRLCPGEVDAATVGSAAPAVYAAVVAPPEPVCGAVTDTEDAPVEGSAIFTVTEATATGGAGRFRMRGGTLGSGLDVLQAVSGGSAVGRGFRAGDDDLAIELPETDTSSWTVGRLDGAVLEPDCTTGIENAVVTLELHPAVRTLLHDSGDDAESFGDDTFSVPVIDDFEIVSYTWWLKVPGDDTWFGSTDETGRSVRPSDLLLEAQDGGRTLGRGAYTVRVDIEVPGGVFFPTFAGFSAAFGGLNFEVTDIRLPTMFAGVEVLRLETPSDGTYSFLYRAPPSAPMKLSGTDSTRVRFEETQHASQQDLFICYVPEGVHFRDGKITHDLTGIELVYTPAATFLMGTGPQYTASESTVNQHFYPDHDVTVPAVLVGKFEVTNDQYAAFVAATGHETYAEVDGRGLIGGISNTFMTGANWRHPVGPDSDIVGKGDYPVAQMTYGDAVAFCDWAGVRLPTEAEFERWQLNTYEKIKFPWNSPRWDDVPYDVGNLNEVVGAGFTGDSYDNVLAPVGSFDPDNYGLHDITGNINEWVHDWYDEDYYDTSPSVHPMGPVSGTFRVTRGGGWKSWPNAPYYTWSRTITDPLMRNEDLGFRVVVDLPGDE
jgi:formylglycine-generating enzyme required for sulfatase activity